MGIEIKSFAIEQADCFLIKIEENGKNFNLLVDCGKKGLESEIKNELGEKNLSGIVVTHVDNDHIVGIIDLMKDERQNIIYKNTFLIFNKYDESLISYEKGRELYEVIKEKFGQKLLIKSYARNYHRENLVIKRRSIETDLLVQILSKKQRMLRERKTLEKDVVYITMLSPDIDILKEFMRDWSKHRTNGKVINRSSVAFLLEFNEKSILMLGDTYVSDACKELEKFRGLKHIDYIKIAHHGAKQNNEGLVDVAKKYLCKMTTVTIKTNQNSEILHPDRELLEQLEKAGCKVYTSTHYVCSDSTDIIQNIKVQDKLII